MKVFNEFFENLKVLILDDIKKDCTRTSELTEGLYYDDRTGEFGKKDFFCNYIYNHQDFRKYCTKEQSKHIKNQFTITYELKSYYHLNPEEKVPNHVLTMLANVNSYERHKIMIYNKYPGQFSDFVGAKIENLDIELATKKIDKYVETKKKNFIDRIEKKAGKIIDAIELHSHIGVLNGVIQCENHKVKIETIYAGGYNIQCLHIRTLFHILKER